MVELKESVRFLHFVQGRGLLVPDLAGSLDHMRSPQSIVAGFASWPILRAALSRFPRLNGAAVLVGRPISGDGPVCSEKLYRPVDLLRRNMPSPRRLPPTTARVAGSGVAEEARCP